ncbi:hypothetical protein P691DRAFT_356508 [Macrolepiota fuliginosa MF-IS2]|uniref:Uncharacterized protein n=1 Tax=Macrolepiota fuliginosa MF-IS2 TaxID=1400762 RepID=A0A9P6C0B8_9AGAR|nr:hypothetical protein P691DRAFT_356508 [Macrolepiota fuliginosa MF-IS2]
MTTYDTVFGLLERREIMTSDGLVPEGCVEIFYSRALSDTIPGPDFEHFQLSEVFNVQVDENASPGPHSSNPTAPPLSHAAPNSRNSYLLQSAYALLPQAIGWELGTSFSLCDSCSNVSTGQHVKCIRDSHPESIHWRTPHEITTIVFAVTSSFFIDRGVN